MKEHPTDYWLDRARSAKRHNAALIDGSFGAAGGAETFAKTSPIDGTVLAEFPVGTVADVDSAVASARTAFDDGRWKDLPVTERKRALFKLADLIAAHTEELAVLDVVDVGKPIRDALNVDLPLSLGVLRYCAEAMDKLLGTVTPADARTLAITVRAPRGVVGGIIGWNFPLVLAVQKMAPALAVGNSLVLKPSELSSFSALRLGELALEAGIPPGVFNVLPGLGRTVGVALAGHPDVDLLTFTGSSATGKKIMQAAGASNMKRLLLECGGKAANIVCEDCPDLDGVADGIMARMFWNQGQVCTAGTRLLVARSVRSALVEKIIARAARLQAGDPFDAATTFGAIVSRPQMDKILNYIRVGREQGASLIHGGTQVRESSGGFFVEPTVFDGVRADMTIAQEEIFGPVLSVMAFDTIDEAIRLANATNYGLSATVWTQSTLITQRMIQSLRAGEITINATGRPAPGAMFGSMPLEPQNQSGNGVESGLEGMSTYTTLKAIQVHT
ncbi:MAG TPA: aldehyde dehydrogenase family protein [Steroidobacteraceae bacterium]|nr:aldehyde dehydrogenase family protein [Steroidobacteraceae bacterium]